MKNQLSFTAIGLVPAILLLGFATAGHPPSLISRETVRVSVAGDASDAPVNRIYCNGGMQGQYSKVHRGWVCSTGLTPVPKH